MARQYDPEAYYEYLMWTDEEQPAQVLSLDALVEAGYDRATIPEGVVTWVPQVGDEE
jgi:hypothetical protein